MRSKTSYFNSTLFQKNLSRFWPLWGGASFVGALFPLALLTVLIREGSFLGEPMSDPLSTTAGCYAVVAWIIPILSLLYAVLCALAAWGWLYNPRSVGMYHALPITRKGIFLTDFLSGLAMMLIPYAVTGTLTILIFAAIGGVEPVGLAVTILSVLGLSFFYFASATAVVFVTGNPFAFAALYFIFHFIAAGAEWLVTRLMTMFYFGVERSYQGVVEFLSPTLYLARRLDVDTEYTQVMTPEGWEQSVLKSATLVNGWLIAVYALAGVVLLACAWALYRRRRSESAGDVVAVGWMKPVFRYGFALCAAFTGGMALYSVFFAGYETTRTANPVPLALCMAASGVIGYYIASMLLSKSLRVFRGSWKGALATLLASAALCAAVALDPLGVEGWTPRPEEVGSVWLRVNSGNGYVGARLTDPALVQDILDVHQAVLAEREDLNKSRRGLGAEDVSVAYLDVTYYEGEIDSPSTSRMYNLPFSQERMERSQALQKLAALAANPAIQEANIFGHVYRENLETRLTGGYAGRLYNPETKEMEQLDLTLEQAKALEAAVRRDVAAGHFGRTLFLLDDLYNQAICTGGLELYYSVTDLDRPQAGPYSETVSLSLSAYCTETLKALEDLGIVNESRRLLTYAEQCALEDGEEGVPYEGDYDPNSFPNTGSVIYPADAYVYPEEAF